MTPEEFDRIDRLAIELESLLEVAMEKDRFAPLRQLMEEAMGETDPKVALQVKLKVELLHEERENVLRLTSMGYEAWGGGNGAEPTKAEPLFEGATIHTYLMRGKIYKAPHDQCPNCWAPWKEKMRSRRCLYCKMEMGKDLKQLIDNGLCPHCEKGRITFEQPTCGECGNTVDPYIVSWG